MVTRSFLPFALTVVLSSLLVAPRCMSQSAPSSSKKGTETDPILEKIRHYGDPSKLQPQFQLLCDAAKKQIEIVRSHEENNEVIDAVHDKQWSDVPDGKTQLVTDYLNAQVENDRSCGALELERGHKGIGLQQLLNLMDAIDLRDAWEASLRNRQLEMRPTTQDALRACEQRKQDLSHLVVQSDPLILEGAEQANWEQIPENKIGDVLLYYETRASIGYSCGLAALRKGESESADFWLRSFATQNDSAFRLLISHFNRTAREYNHFVDDYNKLAGDDAKAWDLVRSADRLIAADNIVISAADRALLSVPPPSLTAPVFISPAPMQPIELHCVTTTSNFGKGATAYTNCY